MNRDRTQEGAETQMVEPTPINLRDRFGNKYKITFDTCYDPKGRSRDKLDPFMMQIPCQYGTIYPDGKHHLRIDIDHHIPTANRVARLPGCELVMDGDFEKTIRFHIERFDAVAAIVKPKRKRVLSETQRDECARRLRPYHFFQAKTRSSESPLSPRTATDALT